MENNNEKFEYSYSSISDEEKMQIDLLRQKYGEKKEEQTAKGEILDRIKYLDNKVEKSGLIASLSVGVIGTLVFGAGLSIVMVWNNLILGIIVSLIGVVGIALAYPLNEFMYKKAKAKYGEEILKLSNQLLENSSEK